MMETRRSERYDENEDYVNLQLQISDLQQQYPLIMEVMEGSGEAHLSAKEHDAFVQFLRLHRKLDDMECEQLYFRGHTDAIVYLKKSKQSDRNDSEYTNPGCFLNLE